MKVTVKYHCLTPHSEKWEICWLPDPVLCLCLWWKEYFSWCGSDVCRGLFRRPFFSVFPRCFLSSVIAFVLQGTRWQLATTSETRSDPRVLHSVAREHDSTLTMNTEYTSTWWTWGFGRFTWKWVNIADYHSYFVTLFKHQQALRETWTYTQRFSHFWCGDPNFTLKGSLTTHQHYRMFRTL